MDQTAILDTIKSSSVKVKSFIKEKPVESAIIALIFGFILGRFVSFLKHSFNKK